jgi:hypothetical protein
LLVGAHLHPADVVAHDEQDVGFLLCCNRPCDHCQRSNQCKHNKTDSVHVTHLLPPILFLLLTSNLKF